MNNNVKKAPLKTRQRLDLIFGLIGHKVIEQDECKKEAFRGIIKEELEAIGLYYDLENMPLNTKIEHGKEFSRLIYKVDKLAHEFKLEGK